MGNAEEEKRHCLFLYKTVRSINIADMGKTNLQRYPTNLRQFQKTKRFEDGTL